MGMFLCELLFFELPFSGLQPMQIVTKLLMAQEPVKVAFSMPVLAAESKRRVAAGEAVGHFLPSAQAAVRQIRPCIVQCVSLDGSKRPTAKKVLSVLSNALQGAVQLGPGPGGADMNKEATEMLRALVDFQQDAL